MSGAGTTCRRGSGFPPHATVAAVRLLLQPIGSADILKNNRFKQKGSVQFRQVGAAGARAGCGPPHEPLTPSSQAQVQLFLRKKLKMKASDSLVRDSPGLVAPILAPYAGYAPFHRTVLLLPERVCAGAGPNAG